MESVLRTIRKHLKEYFRLCAASGFEVEKSTDLLQSSDGTFFGVDYADRTCGDSWSPRIHLNAMRNLALRNPDAARRALDAWCRFDCTTPNWWHQSIGTPLLICETLFLLDLSVESGTKLREILDRSQQRNMTAQNKLWIAGITLMKGVLYDDFAMVGEGVEQILSEIRIAYPGEEGIQPDYSFHQHGPQMQFGNYGLSWFFEITRWIVVLKGTPFAIPDDRRKIAENFFRNGLRWTLYKNIMDVNACGRQIARNYPALKYHKLLFCAKRLQSAGLLKDLPPEELEPRAGSVYFPSSAYLIHRTEKFFFSVKMCAPDVIGTETINSENLLGRFAGDGAVFLYRKDKEWNPINLVLRDWRKVPGTTELQDTESLECERIRNTDGFACGIADGKFSASALRFRNGKFSADKAFFCFENYIAFAGCGIASKESGEIMTTLVQTFRDSPVTFPSWNGEAPPVLPPGESLVPGKMRFVYDGLEYILPEQGEFHIVQNDRRGDWKDINGEEKSQPASGRMLTVFQNHGRRPVSAGYFYLIHPLELPAPDMEILHGSNSDIVGIRDKTSGCVMIAFFLSGRISVPGMGVIEENKPSLHLIRTGSYRIARL